ncbi:DNA replication licensing factor MCM4 [Nematocida sp. AWRm80]|nr:DNA replication licensing factor MCM4 [Nematocida sp. AWRm80]
MQEDHSQSETNRSAILSFEDASQLMVGSTADLETIQSENSTNILEDTKGYSQCNERVVWGTTINIEETKEMFKRFIRGYTTEEGEYLYLQKIKNMQDIHQYDMLVDCSHLIPEHTRLLNELVNYPLEMIPLFEMAVMDIYLERYPTGKPAVRVFLKNTGNRKEIKELLPSDIDKLIEVTGMVTKTSGIIPDILTAVYRCNKCGQSIPAEVIRGVISEPVDCVCQEKFSMEMDSSLSYFQDKQIIKVQELPESSQDGSVPLTITCVAYNAMTDGLSPGDKVKITGVYKAVPLKLNYIHRTIKSSFKTYIEVISYIKIADQKISTENASVLEQIEELRTSDRLYERLAESIAPSIYGMLDVKKALLLQLFGGVTKSLNGSRFRGDINVLLAGDPGVAKSQLLLAVHRLIDRGVYTSGKGSSAVGLTANVVRDSESGQYILEPGALVISDGGVCCVDEFDKMGENTRSVLHEAMEQQTVSVAKAGIITTLNARCSILAACNPINSSYDPKKNIIENLNIPPTLLSRFDIVCLLLDKIDLSRDREISSHILKLYAGTEQKEDPPVSHSALMQYIKEGRRINPTLTPEASEIISQEYQELRNLGNGKSVSATTRQLESLIRLSEAHARMRLSQTVDPKDVQEAARLIKDSIHIYAVDPITGRIDMELIHAGKTSAAIKQEDTLKEDILKNIGKGSTVPLLLEKLNQTTRVSEKTLLHFLEELQEEDKLIIDGLCITPY